MGKILTEKIESLSVDRQAKIQMMADEFISSVINLRILQQARGLTQVQVDINSHYATLSRSINCGSGKG